MDKLFQMGGMMEMEQVQLCNILDQKDASERMKEAQDMWGFFKKGRHDVYISDIVVYETNECRMENCVVIHDPFFKLGLGYVKSVFPYILGNTRRHEVVQPCSAGYVAAQHRA